ncbi:MAG: hypothetical protein ACW96N_04620 [Candidatus Thorarchaeota archaeon]|jgi:hypothetical protein
MSQEEEVNVEEPTTEVVTSTTPWLDKTISKVISRKLTVFLVGTAFIVLGFVTAENWMTLAVAYIGTQGFIDAVKAYRDSG